ncbi:MAG: clostripain-related cysteine peptidase [Pseudomonadota bacterium]
MSSEKRKLERNPDKREWAFMAYIAGDNNLSDAGLEDIEELCQEGASDKVHVGVEIDTYGEHTGSIRYEITKSDYTGTAHRVVLERLPEKDSGDPESLRSFMDWGFHRFCADKTLTVIWNHGAGFRLPRRDIGIDDFGSSLDMPEIEGVFKRAGLGGDNKIEVLGFDACLMNMVEIAHHFKDFARVVVGSEQTEPGDGWPYDKVLKAMKESADGSELGTKIVREYITSYKDIGVYGVTQSAIDLAKTDEVVKALSDLGALLAANISKFGPKVKDIRRRIQSFEYADYVDLIHAANGISSTVNDPQVTTACKTLVQCAEACVISSETYGDSVQNAHGLSVWFPPRADLYDNYRAKYMCLKAPTSYPGWVDFLDAYHT